MPAVACPPGDCDDCETWNEETKTCDWDCTTGQCCQNDDCVATCSGCYKCVDNYCEQCKCWDDGNPITGSINVQDAKLCEEVTHTSSISDTDHWFKGGNGGEGCEGSPSDTIYTYSWSKTTGTNPESGTFTGTTDEDTVEWRAPPCTGTVNIKLTADDKPDSMDNPCPDSERDDPSEDEDFEGTSTVSLPDGCDDCGTPGDVTPNITEDPSCVFCDPYDWGYAAPIGPHTYTLKTPCYDSCKWFAYLDKVDSIFNICRSCPANPPTVACLDDVAQMSQTEACDHLQNFPNNPVQLSDIDEDNSCRDCVVVHEETHMNKDWKGDSLQPEIDEFAYWCAGHEIDIDCGDSDSTDCTTALTTSVKDAYDEEWNDRVVAALNAYHAGGDDDAYPAYLACYQDIYNALDAKCNP